ncbi:MAG: cyclic nucleotide-binding domain-containing protein [Polyangiales bacterium]
MIAREKLRAIGAFDDYSDQELELLLMAGAARSYAPGHDLCVQGAVGTECFIVLEGVIEVIKSTSAGERCIATVTAGAIVGQLALAGRGRRTATLRAAEPVSVLVIERATYEHLLDACSPVALRFQQQIAVSCIRQLRGTVARLTEALGTGASQRPGDSVPPPSMPSRASSRPPRPSPGDEVKRYLDSTAEELRVTLDDPGRVAYVREITPKTKGPR